MKLVHDYLLQMGGAERLVAVLHEAFPEAPILTSAVDRDRLLPSLAGADIRTTWMQNLPGIRRHFKKYYLLYPAAFRSFPPVEDRIAVISTTGYAKYVRTSPDTISYCYLHAPTRFLWDGDAYLRREIPNALVRRLVQRSLRPRFEEDVRATREMDHLIANSEHVRARIRSIYGRDAVVIYPPIDLSRFSVGAPPSVRSGSPPVGPPGGPGTDFYLVVSRLVGYKRIDRAVRAFTESGRRLVVVGDGPDRRRLEGMAGPTVDFRGRVPDEAVTRLMRECRALVFPGTEDFGMTAVEIQACGRPVLAWGDGGALESVVEGETGLFFGADTGRSLRDALETFEEMSWDPGAIRRHAERFGTDRFVREMRDLIESTSGESVHGGSSPAGTPSGPAPPAESR